MTFNISDSVSPDPCVISITVSLVKIKLTRWLYRLTVSGILWLQPLRKSWRWSKCSETLCTSHGYCKTAKSGWTLWQKYTGSKRRQNNKSAAQNVGVVYD